MLFCARGDIFTAPAEKGPTRNLTRSSNAHDKWPRWSPDGSRIAFISDKSGEEEVHVVAQDGLAPPEQLTQGGKAMRYAPEWSPDGKRIAFSDKDGKLYVLTLASRKLVEVADSPRGQVNDYVWSPRGNHLAFSMADSGGFSSIYVWSEKDAKLRRITDLMFNEYNPAPAGITLYKRPRIRPQISSSIHFASTARQTFMQSPCAKTEAPFPPESDG